MFVRTNDPGFVRSWWAVPKKHVMKKAPVVLLLAIAALAYSCGGTIGNIEKYTFEVNADTLRAAVERVF